MHEVHEQKLDLHHVLQQPGVAPPTERREVKELLELLVNRSVLSGPLANESLYDVPFDHMEWMLPKLKSPVFNPVSRPQVRYF
jgi:hypothetical protein